ncbi:MAG: hypothetical protein WD738_22440 [Pirellulales bacterium]
MMVQRKAKFFAVARTSHDNATQPPLIRVALLLALLPALGCGYRSGLERVHVSGKASYGNQPIEVGQIRFVPIESTRGPITVELIRDGEYETATSGGVPVGTHRVELRMYDPEEYRTTPRVPGAPAIKQLLPPQFNQDSELTITIDSGSGSIERDFALEE